MCLGPSRIRYISVKVQPMEETLFLLVQHKVVGDTILTFQRKVVCLGKRIFLMEVNFS